MGTAGGVPAASIAADSLGSSYGQEQMEMATMKKSMKQLIMKSIELISKLLKVHIKLRDLGIQVMVEPPTPNDPNSLPQNSINDITNILGTIIRTSLPKNANGQPLTNAEVNQKIAVSVQPFNGKTTVATAKQQTSIPIWAYVVGGVLLLAIIILLVLYIRSRRNEEEEEEIVDEEVVFEIPDLPEEQESEATIKRKQLEKLAKEKPDDFAKLLRSWIAED